MNSADFFQIILFLALLAGLSPLLGKYMARVFMGEKHFMKPVFGWLEKGVYRLSGIDSNAEMNWKTFTFSLLVFNFAGFVSDPTDLTYILQTTRPGDCISRDTAVLTIYPGAAVAAGNDTLVCPLDTTQLISANANY
jgi:hypothetical protein